MTPAPGQPPAHGIKYKKVIIERRNMDQADHQFLSQFDHQTVVAHFDHGPFQPVWLLHQTRNELQFFQANSLPFRIRRDALGR